jgi:hypothetical protein
MTTRWASAETSPSVLPFELQDGEYIIALAQRHWLFLWPRVVALSVIAIVPVIIAWLVAAMTTDIEGLLLVVLVVGSILWAGFWALQAFLAWYRYQHDIWVVTSQRLIDSRKNHWFHHQMASADLVDVEDMMIERSGVFATMFNHGNVRCQTAGMMQNFVLADIPHPAEMLKTVDAARDAARRDVVRLP